MKELLIKARTLHNLVRCLNPKTTFGELAKILSGYVEANVFMIGRRGKILGYSFYPEDFDCNINEVIKRSECFPQSYNQDLLLKTVIRENIEQVEKTCLFHNFKECPLLNRKVTIAPVVRGKERLATLVLVKKEDGLSEKDLLLVEISTIVAGFLVLGMKAERLIKDTKRQTIYQTVLKALSVQEIRALQIVLKLLDGEEGIVVITKIAQENEISRALIINALQKLAGAGALALRSHGMKGTSIKVLDEDFLNELQKIYI